MCDAWSREILLYVLCGMDMDIVLLGRKYKDKGWQCGVTKIIFQFCLVLFNLSAGIYNVYSVILHGHQYKNDSKCMEKVLNEWK